MLGVCKYVHRYIADTININIFLVYLLTLFIVEKML